MIKGENIVLHYHLPSDLMLEWRNSPDIFRYTRQFTLLDQRQHEKYLNSLADNTNIKLFSIKAGADFVGICGFTSINYHDQNAEFSLYIAPAYQKLGYGEDALRTLVKHGFDAFNFQRIWGETFEFNHAAKMFERIGFKKEGVLRSSYYREGRHIDSYIYGILKGELI
ncbi:MAG: GNAT family N-acetyltransferase [Candidatus Methylopumilus sp.]|nr:GNAT family N-acetyltransferase [Candidatus Methylopumilus sp.]